MNKQYDDLKKKIAALDIKSEQIYALQRKLLKELAEVRRNFMLPCDCGGEIRVGDIELIREEVNHWMDSDNEVRCTTKEYFACPHCHAALDVPKHECFSGEFSKYVKIVHTWDSDRTRPHGRVLELMTPWWDRQRAADEQEKRLRRLEEARRILREAGEL